MTTAGSRQAAARIVEAHEQALRFLAAHQAGFPRLAGRNVADRRRGADDVAMAVVDRRDCDPACARASRPCERARRRDARPARRYEAARGSALFLLAQIRRHHQVDRLADGFSGAPSQTAVRALVPRGDDAVERLADRSRLQTRRQSRRAAIALRSGWRAQDCWSTTPLAALELALRAPHRFAKHDDRHARQHVDDKADGFVDGEPAEVAEAAAEHHTGGDPAADRGHRARAPIPLSTPRRRWP